MTTIKTARAAGAWYLGLAVTGMLGFLLLRPSLIDADDPTATLANLTDHASQAHLLVLLEMAIVVTQALAAVFFYKLFRPLNTTAAYATATFGMVNAVAIMASGAFMATANSVAANPSLAPGGDAAGTVALLYELSASSWGHGQPVLWAVAHPDGVGGRHHRSVPEGARMDSRGRRCGLRAERSGELRDRRRPLVDRRNARLARHRRRILDDRLPAHQGHPPGTRGLTPCPSPLTLTLTLTPHPHPTSPTLRTDPRADTPSATAEPGLCSASRTPYGS